MELKPLGDRLIAEPIEHEELSASGILLPATARDKSVRARVLAIGPGARSKHGARIAMDVIRGDTVLYAKYAGTEVRFESKRYLILKETDVLAVVR